MFNKFSKIISAAYLFMLPVLANAGEPLAKTDQFFKNFRDIIEEYLIPIAFLLALLYFFYGVAKYIWSEGSGSKESGRQIMVWGIVALFVISSVWGIVYFLRNELGVEDDSSIPIPTINSGLGNV